ncbi:hypothetical protein WN943_001768 [Citrus x changshan-huyou]
MFRNYCLGVNLRRILLRISLKSEDMLHRIMDNDGTVIRVTKLPTEFIEDAVEYLYVVESDDGTLSVVSRRVVQVPPTHLGYPTEENTFKTSGFQCKPNCIYFADDFVDSYSCLTKEESVEAGVRDTGIYNTEDGSIEPFFKE